MLLDVRERNGSRRFTVNQIAIEGEQPRLAHKKAVICSAADEAVAVGSEHCAALAGVERVIAWTQSYKVILRSDDHSVSLLLLIKNQLPSCASQGSTPPSHLRTWPRGDDGPL